MSMNGADLDGIKAGLHGTSDQQFETFIKPAVEEALEGINTLGTAARETLLRTLTEWTRDTATKLGLDPDDACARAGLNDV